MANWIWLCLRCVCVYLILQVTTIVRLCPAIPYTVSRTFIVIAPRDTLILDMAAQLIVSLQCFVQDTAAVCFAGQHFSNTVHAAVVVVVVPSVECKLRFPHGVCTEGMVRGRFCKRICVHWCVLQIRTSDNVARCFTLERPHWVASCIKKAQHHI